MQFLPRLAVLPPPQRQLWTELNAIPEEFVLYGGTALALHLGHRESVDFDFFGNRPLNPLLLETRVPFLAGAKVVQRDESTLTVIVERGGAVMISFFGVPKLPRLRPAHIAPNNRLRIASLLDLAGTKASVVQVRAEAKDYVDIHALITQTQIDLPMALAAAQMLYGPTFNPEITLKALSYFDDGNLRELPDELKNHLAAAAREVDLDRLPLIGEVDV